MGVDKDCPFYNEMQATHSSLPRTYTNQIVLQFLKPVILHLRIFISGIIIKKFLDVYQLSFYHLSVLKTQRSLVNFLDDSCKKNLIWTAV